jgi:hypothetical protein
MMKAWIYLFLICPGMLFAQEGRGDIRFVFYNVENLYDPFDDSLALDDEFLPGGIKRWTWERFLEKERRICKVLASVGGWKPPEIIGLCEIENRFVLDRLTRKTPLMKYNYRIVHRDSPDERGIDVALLYLPGKFRPLESKFIGIGALAEPTRDVLYVRGLVPERDTIHLLVCHWPSRWEGYLESMPGRLEAARIVRGVLDSLWKAHPAPKILVAGDLNDELCDPGIASVLRVDPRAIRPPAGDPVFIDTVLYHTGDPGFSEACRPGRSHSGPGNEQAGRESTGQRPGTLKYRGRWYEFDHIFASGSFFTGSNLFILPGSKVIYAPGFLLEEDPGLPGKRPFRTWQGHRYYGGFIDHLPVYIYIRRRD